MQVQIIEVPSPLGLRPGGVELAPRALRDAGLHECLDAAADLQLEIPPYSGVRDQATGVLNPAGIAQVARRLADAVGAAIDAHQFPVVLGGDCSIVLGPLLALRRRGRYGLAYLDAQADFQHPDDEPLGEVASLDLALATGRGPVALADLDGLRPLVRDEDVALVGYRVFRDNDRFGDQDIRSTAISVLDLQAVRGSGTGSVLQRALATVTEPALDGFWVHFDVDVLDDNIMPAVDYRHPDGLSWQEAGELLTGLLGHEMARGLEVTIFNPALDHDASIAGNLSDLIARSLQTVL